MRRAPGPRLGSFTSGVGPRVTSAERARGAGGVGTEGTAPLFGAHTDTIPGGVSRALPRAGDVREARMPQIWEHARRCGCEDALLGRPAGDRLMVTRLLLVAGGNSHLPPDRCRELDEDVGAGAGGDGRGHLTALRAPRCGDHLARR